MPDDEVRHLRIAKLEREIEQERAIRDGSEKMVHVILQRKVS